jgi:hypothetical protein
MKFSFLRHRNGERGKEARDRINQATDGALKLRQFLTQIFDLVHERLCKSAPIQYIDWYEKD